MAPSAKSTTLLPIPAKDLALLSDSKVQMVLESVDRERARRHSYAMFAMAVGGVSFISCLGCAAYMDHIGYPRTALLVLGTAVLSTIGKMIASRL
jgi:hypothetical protein